MRKAKALILYASSFSIGMIVFGLAGVNLEVAYLDGLDYALSNVSSGHFLYPRRLDDIETYPGIGATAGCVIGIKVGLRFFKGIIINKLGLVSAEEITEALPKFRL